MRKIRFRLVVVVVTHEILDGVSGEKLSEFVVQLAGQCLVVNQHQSRLLDTLDQVGHRKGLAGAGDAEEDLVLLAGPHSGGEFLDRLTLVPTRGERGFQLELFHLGHGGHLTIRAAAPVEALMRASRDGRSDRAKPLSHSDEK